ncbi:MAG: hypothetical protein K8S99_17490 [Planctomycetes bacterium]|nr:hypothetical protein [Planctomycetota bacterium]
MRQPWAVVLLSFLLCGVAAAAQAVHSNGQGGGRWTDPGAWHGGTLPEAGDIVIIATRDTVEFDGTDASKPTCARIQIDPGGTLAFRSPLGDDKYTLIVNGPIESYGTLRLDATASPRGSVELRLVSDDSAQRVVRLLQNGSFLAYGRKGMQGDRRNVIISTREPEKGKPRLAAMVVANNDSMLDVADAHLSDVVLFAADLDNTGAASNERLNIAENRFTGLARVSMIRCDTPTVRDNVFTSGDAVLPEPAISAGSCQLAQVIQNRITGGYGCGVSMEDDVDSSVTENSVEKAAKGMFWRGRNAMIKGNIFKDCTIGVQLHAMSGVVESLVIEGAKTDIDLLSSVVQFTDCRAGAVAKDGTVLNVNVSAATLLNCNIPAEAIKVNGAAPGGGPPVEAMQYVVVRVNGKYAPGTKVDIRTNEASGGKPTVVGAADLNVRNSPAPLTSDGLTPLPRSLRALVLRSWRLDAAGKKMAPAFFYDMTVTAPADKPDQPPKVLKSQVIEPSDKWYRAEANAPTPTMEVTLP